MQPKSVQIRPTAAYTAATDIALDNLNGAHYLDLVIDITAYTAGSLTVTVQGVCPVSSKKYTLIASAALAAAATTVLRLGPALTAAANLTVNYACPPKMNVNIAVGDATAITYSISAVLR